MKDSRLHQAFLVALLFTLVVVAPGIRAQAPPPAAPAAAPPNLTFEVASVKPNKGGQPFVRVGMAPSGRFEATNVPLRELVRIAYQVQNHQIVGLPSWSDARFDIVAKAPEGAITPGPFDVPNAALPTMMRALLAERFKLAAHTETRDMPVFALMKARSDGKLGTGLTASSTDCAAQAAARRGGPAGPAGPPAPPAPPQPGEPFPCGMMMGPGNIRAGAMRMEQLAQALSVRVGRTIIDKTDLPGTYDFSLTFTPELPPGAGPGVPGGPGGPPLVNGQAIDPNGPSLYTALTEQLGLKLDSQRGPVEMLILDHIEQPTED